MEEEGAGSASPISAVYRLHMMQEVEEGKRACHLSTGIKGR